MDYRLITYYRNCGKTVKTIFEIIESSKEFETLYIVPGIYEIWETLHEKYPEEFPEIPNNVTVIGGHND